MAKRIQCRTCKKRKIETAFYSHTNGGRYTQCKACANAARLTAANDLRRRRVEFIEQAVKLIPEWVEHLPGKHRSEAAALLELMT